MLLCPWPVRIVVSGGLDGFKQQRATCASVFSVTRELSHFGSRLSLWRCSSWQFVEGSAKSKANADFCHQPPDDCGTKLRKDGVRR